MVREKSIGESRLAGNPVKRLLFKLGFGSVKEKNLAGDVLYKLNRISDLQNQIDSLEFSGLALSDRLGNDSHIGISQRAITEEFSRVWDKIGDMTGEVFRGVDMQVTPNYYTGSEGCDIYIKVISVGDIPIDYLAVYINDELVREDENIGIIEYSASIEGASTIKCVARIMGIEYIKTAAVLHQVSFWLGAGATYADIMNTACLKPVNSDFKGNYEVTCSHGDHIILMMDSDFAVNFTKATMDNFLPISFEESLVTVDGHRYKVFTSYNGYQEGTYTIGINS